METRSLESMIEFLGDRTPVFKEVKHRLCSREDRKILVEKLKKLNNSAMEGSRKCGMHRGLHKLYACGSSMVHSSYKRDAKSEDFCSVSLLGILSKCFFTVIPICL